MKTAVGYPEIVAFQKLAQKAELSNEARHVTLWCVDQLPNLYENFRRTNESRFADSIAGLAQAVLKRLGEPSQGIDASQVADGLVARLGELHERLGLAPLRLKTVPALVPARKKRVKSG